MNKAQDIFGIKHIPVIDYQISNTRLVSGNSTFTISTVNPSNPNVILGVVFSCVIPEIKGVGQMKFCDYLGYQLISNVIISFHSTGESAKISGSHIFDTVSQMPNRDELFYNAGHNDVLRKEIYSQIDNECLKPQTKISVWIPLPFGHNFPHNVMKQPPKTELTITINLRNITDVIDCNDNFRMVVLNSIVTQNTLDVEGLYLPTNLNVVPMFNLSYESEFYKLSSCENDNNNFMTIPIDTSKCITSLKWRPIVDFSKLRYLCLYDNWKTPEQAVNNFMKAYLAEAIIISDKPIEEIKLDYPQSALIEEVNGGVTTISTLSSGKLFNKKISIIIDKLPLKYKIYYHKNLLKYEGVHEINISEKLNIVKGFFHEGKFIIEYLEHNCTDLHASLPLQIFNINNRIKGAESMSIKKYYLSGYNFIRENIEDFVSILSYDDLEKNNRKFETYHPCSNIDTNRFHCYNHNKEIKYYKLENRLISDSASLKIAFKLCNFNSDKLERKYAEVSRSFSSLNHYDTGLLSLLSEFVSLELIRYSLVKIETLESADGSTSLKMLPHKN